jgi:hypothetical protein
MKESIGGTWLYGLAITLIALFTTFVSVTTNYARTYKIKDHIISIIEANDGVTPDTLAEISDYLSSTGYASTGECPESRGNSAQWHGFSYKKDETKPVGFGTNANYCLVKYTVTCRVKDSTDDTSAYLRGQQSYNSFPRAYYGVATFFRLDWPILRQVIKVNLTGETSIIYLVNNSAEIDVFQEESLCK